MDEIVGVKIKQEQDPREITPEEDLLEISPEIIKTDLDDIVKTEDQYCMNHGENCSNNFSSENGLFLKEENVSLGVAEENSVNKIDIDEQELPTHDESDYKQWVKEEQGIERRENALDEKVLVRQKLDLPKISSEAITELHTEIDLDITVVKSEDQLCINLDNLASEKELVSKDFPSVEAVQSSEALKSEYDSDIVKNLVNKTDYDQQAVSGQAFFQENIELQTDIIKLKQAEKRKRGTRNSTSVSKKRRLKCRYCDYETQNSSHLKLHVSAIHEKGNAKVYYCHQCTFKTLYSHSLISHMRIHEDRGYKCLSCYRGFTTKAYLDSHVLMNHDNLQHLITHEIHHCKFCTYKTIYSKYLIHHIAQNHNRGSAEKFHCYKCDYFSLKKNHLKKHLLVHSNLKPYLCAVCKNGFRHKRSLDYHILRTHKGNADILKKITNKIHKCTFCTFETIIKQCLRTHMKRQHKQTSV